VCGFPGIAGILPAELCSLAFCRQNDDRRYPAGRMPAIPESNPSEKSADFQPSE